MSRRHLTLTVIPEAGGRIRSIGLPHSALILLVFFLLLSLVALAALVKFGVEKAVNASVVKIQSEENQIINQRIEDFDSELSLIAARLDTVKAIGKRVRELSNIERDPQDAAASETGDQDVWEAQTEEAVSARLDILVRETSATRGRFDRLLESLGQEEYSLNHTPSIRPAAGWLISGYGYTRNPFTGRTEMHLGVDIAAVEGTPICATADGRVAFVGNKPGYGLTVVLDHGSDISTWYGHCSAAKVSTGQTVKRGMVIATIGKTGQAIGPHVQYEVRIKGVPVDPVDFFLDVTDN